jgi:hypothetical protein
MKVVTYATHSFGTFDTLVQSVPDIVVLGWGTKWNGFMDKFNAVIEHLETLPDNEIVMFVDGFDSIINKDLSDVEKVFKSMNCKILLSKHTGVIRYISKKVFKECSKVTANSGLYMGYNKYVKELLREALETGEDDDQRALNIACSKTNFIKIDTDHIIFENCFNSNECVQKSKAFVVQTPGQMSVSRYSRAIKEYGKYFTLEILLIVLIISYILMEE